MLPLASPFDAYIEKRSLRSYVLDALISRIFRLGLQNELDL